MPCIHAWISGRIGKEYSRGYWSDIPLDKKSTMALISGVTLWIYTLVSRQKWDCSWARKSGHSSHPSTVIIVSSCGVVKNMGKGVLQDLRLVLFRVKKSPAWGLISSDILLWTGTSDVFKSVMHIVFSCILTKFMPKTGLPLFTFCWKCRRAPRYVILL